ncbi:MAG: response regulator [Anaerolineae bacterium]|nr:response regulator [Anaerolineae bacterium]
MDEKPRVLIIDDEPSAREIIEDYLWREDYDLISLSSGLEALAQIKDIAPDIVLLDVMMPHLDGFEVCRRLRADPELAEIPIVMVTALEDRDAHIEGIQAGADDFLTKPIDSALLKARVRTIIRLNRYRHLLEERRKFEWLVENSQDGILILDAGGNIRYLNVTARLYFNLSIDTISDSTISDSTIPDSTIPDSSFLALARRHYQLQPIEAWEHWPAQRLAVSDISPCYLVRPETFETTALWLAVTVFPLAQESSGSWVVRLQDITSEISAYQGIYEFHALISHKLRTPLTHIMGGIDIVAEFGDTLDAEKRREYLQLAQVGTQRLHSTLETILAYRERVSGIAPGGIFDVRQLPDVLAEIQEQLNLESLCYGAADVTAFVQLSREDITLVLMELLKNAQKFHPSHTPVIEVSLTIVDASMLRLQVVDDGRHLPPEQFAHIWRPYYQSDRYFTGEIPGLGLGLPLVAILVWNAGGNCRAYNRPEKAGLVVELLLPRASN